MPNVTNLNALIDLLEQIPDEKFNFNTCTHDTPDLCGTPACVAGWAYYLQYKGDETHVTKAGKLKLGDECSFVQPACAFLGIDYNDEALVDTIFNNNYDYVKTRADVVKMLKQYRDTGVATFDEK